MLLCGLPSIGGRGTRVIDLAYGWAAIKFAPEFGLYCVSDGRTARSRPVVARLRGARRHATVGFLRDEFGDAPGAGEFLGRFADTFDWAGLAAWADYLDDHQQDEVAGRLRALLPKSVVPGQQ
jgi:hypothetical protein